MSLQTSLDDAEAGIIVQDRFSVSIHLPITYSTSSTRAIQSTPILNTPHIPQLEKPLPPLPRPVSKTFVNVQLPPPRRRLEHRPSRWIRFLLWFNTYR